MQRPLLTRSVSEPGHVRNASLLTACSITRVRSKESVLTFEQGKDCIALWLNKWNKKEVLQYYGVVLVILFMAVGVLYVGGSYLSMSFKSTAFIVDGKLLQYIRQRPGTE